MLSSYLREAAARYPDKPALVHGAASLSYRDLAAQAERIASDWSALAGKSVALAFTEPFELVPAMTALDALGAHAYLAGVRDDDELCALQSAFGWEANLRGTSDALPPLSGSRTAVRLDTSGLVSILTSGTTGIPKAVNHTWATLARPVRQHERYADSRWFVAYPLTLYAGIQVLLQALLNGALLVTSPTLRPEEVARTLADNGVMYASGTPTFWRNLMLFGGRAELQACSLRQITLGGEAVTQDVLDSLRSVFPEARIVHIYASTEMGRLFTVTDGRAGFPAGYLDTPPEPGVELRVADGQLWVRSSNRMIGYEGRASGEDADRWFPTGDLVELRDDRVVFLGRDSDIINVGGAKVSPAAVEEVLRSVCGVANVRVYGKSSSIVGALVAADIQSMPESDPEQVRAAVVRHARERLLPFQVPRVIRMVESIRTNAANKVVRRD